MTIRYTPSMALIAKQVVIGVSRPLFVTAPPGDKGRLFIVEQGGNIRIFDLAAQALKPVPFLKVTGLSNGNEQGLLGLAFHPGYATNGLFFVSFTATNGTSVLQRLKVSGNPDVADSTSATTVLTVPQPFSNHNGGWIGFSPKDGFLYFALGDGGSEEDPNRTSQNMKLLLGKMLRLDIDKDDFPGDATRNYAIPADNPFRNVPNVLPEIWASGLRNPWRCSFDRATGDFYIGDVGQGRLEEVDFLPAGSPGGTNFGWSLREGTLPFNPVPGANPPTVDPIFEYTHDDGEQAIIGGYVYRGAAIPELAGTYFFGDMTGTASSFKFDGHTPPERQSRTDELFPGGFEDLTSFGEDALGEIYLCLRGGKIFKIVAA